MSFNKKQSAIESSSIQRFTWNKYPEKIDKETLLDFIDKYLQSIELKKLEAYSKYYDGENVAMTNRFIDKRNRNKTPNIYLPTGYYSTIISTMSGYMFQNVKYNQKENEAFQKELQQLLYDNTVEVKDMITGIRALVYNKSAEIVYTVGDGVKTEIKFTPIDPRQIIFVYDESIEPELISGIFIRKSLDEKYDYYVDVLYADEWQFYNLKDKTLSERESPRQLFFSECPVVEYRTDIMNSNSSFHTIIPYIDALDFVMSGNSNEIDRLVDAMLVLGKIIKDEDLQHMEEWKVLEGMKTEDRAEYITKDMSPQFREYVSKLLIQEIHKHSHVIDWYSPDSGMSGEVSGKALTTRLFDMDIFSKQLEKVYIQGLKKRIRLITELMSIQNKQVGEVEIVLNRTLPDMMIDTAQALKDIPFIDDETKIELCGLDSEKIKKRMEEQKKEIDITEVMRNGERTNEENTESENNI